MHRRAGVVLALAVLVAVLPGGGQVSADSGVTSLSAGCSPNDITTGGGWIAPDRRDKRTFGFHAGVGPNAPVPGRLVFFNHLEDERLKGVIISYTPNPTNTRIMLGLGQVNEETVLFTLTVMDNSPDAPDFLSLTYATSEGPRHDSGPLGGGSIQIHPMCP